MEYRKKAEAATGPVSASDLAKLYAEQAHLNDLSEKVTEGFIDTAVTVFERALNVPQIRDAIQDAEAQWGVKTTFPVNICH